MQRNPVLKTTTNLFLVTEDVLDPRALEAQLDKPENGAVVTFQGVVRDNSRGRTVSYLEYDAYAPMATKVMAQIADEIKAKWPVTDVAIWHRIGRLEIGEASLLVVVTAGHRKEAFEACHHAVDRIKEIVPVWKKEVWDNGESWVEGDVLVADGLGCVEEETGHSEDVTDRPMTPAQARRAVRDSLSSDSVPKGQFDAEEFKRYVYDGRQGVHNPPYRIWPT